MSTTELPRNNGVSAAPGSAQAPSTVLAPPRRQRRTGRLALAGAFVALCAVATPAAWVFFSETESVVGVVGEVPYGQRITAGDLVEMSVPADGGINVVDWAARDTVIGAYAGTDLQAGQLLPDGATTPKLTPAAGSSIVAVGVKSAFAPGAQLAAGDSVRVVAVRTSPGDTVPADPADLPGSVIATVYSISPQAPDGTTVVAVIAADGDADAIARLSAVGQAALVLLPKG